MQLNKNQKEREIALKKIEQYRSYKERLVATIRELENRYNSGVISQEEYASLIQHYLKGHSLEEHLRYYDREIELLQKEVKEPINPYTIAAIVILVLMIGAFFLTPAITGYFVIKGGEKEISYNKVQDDPTFDVVIDSKVIKDGDLIIKFHHNSETEKPISVIGNIEYNLDKDVTEKDEIVTLIVYDYSNKYFKLKVGTNTEIIEFGKNESNVTEVIEFGEIGEVPLEEVIQGKAEINKPVKWVKKIRLNETSGNLTVKIPKSSFDIKIINEAQKEISFDKKIEVMESDKETELVIKEEVKEIEVEYYTEGPKITEREISDNRKEVIISSDIHYENILAYTTISEAKKDLIKLYRTSGGVMEQVGINEYVDSNNNGLIDKISWVVPFLSNETYEVVIEISKAAHLNQRREFISDIYDEVSQLDDIWSELINDNEYVRVTFKQELDNTKDITVYPRIINGTPKIEVYEINGTEIITEFKTITSNEYNKIYLTNLQGTQDTFDLRVVGGGVEFDYIVDPASNYLVNESAHQYATSTGPGAIVGAHYCGGKNIIRLNSNRLVAFWENQDDDSSCADSTTGGVTWSAINSETGTTTHADMAIATNGSSIVYVINEANSSDIDYIFRNTGVCDHATGAYADISTSMNDHWQPDVAYDGYNNRFVVCATDNDDNDSEFAYSSAVTGATITWTLVAASGVSGTTTLDSCSIDVTDIGDVFIAADNIATSNVVVYNSSNLFTARTQTTAYASAVNDLHMSIRGDLSTILITAVDTSSDLVVIYSTNNGTSYSSSVLAGTFLEAEGCVDSTGKYHIAVSNTSGIFYIQYSDGSFNGLATIAAGATYRWPSVRCSNFPSNNRMDDADLELVYTDTATNIYFANYTIPYAPVVQNVTINPGWGVAPNSTDVLDCSFNVTDASTADTIKCSVTWWNNTNIHWGQDNETLTANNGKWTNTSVTGDLENTDHSIGENWFCEVNCTDGTDVSNSKNSSKVTISNQAPTWTTIIADNTTAEDYGQFVWEQNLSLGTSGKGKCSDADPGTILTYTVQSENTAEVDCTANNETLILRPAANWSGTASCTINCTDGNGSAVDTFNIEVKAVNDVPYISPVILDNETSLNNPWSYILTSHENDVDDTGLNWSYQVNDTGKATISISNATDNLSITPSAVGLLSFNLTVRDNNGSSATQTNIIFNITAAVNNAPDVIIANITNNGSAYSDQAVDPREHANASVAILAVVVDPDSGDCDADMNVTASICNLATLGGCSDSSYSYAVNLTYQEAGATTCNFTYNGTDIMEFWDENGTWKIDVKAIDLSADSDTLAASFTYNALLSVNYSSSIGLSSSGLVSTTEIAIFNDTNITFDGYVDNYSDYITHVDTFRIYENNATKIYVGYNEFGASFDYRYTDYGIINFNISYIPNNAIINQVNLTVVVNKSFTSKKFNISHIEKNPLTYNSSSDNISFYKDLSNGTNYVADSAVFQTTGTKIIDLGDDAKTNLQNNLANDWFAVGFFSTGTDVKAAVINSSEDNTGRPILQVSYTYDVTSGVTLGAWNVNSSSYNMTNYGNINLSLNWSITNFGGPEAWIINGTDVLIDDEATFGNDVGNLLPKYLNTTVATFVHPGGLATCNSYSCLAPFNASLDTFFHFYPPTGLKAGVYSTNMTITLTDDV